MAVTRASMLFLKYLCLAYTPQPNSTMAPDTFEIPITWNDAEISFPARFIAAGYVTKIGVDVYGQELVLEPDEEGQYRLVMEVEHLESKQGVDLALLKEIAQVLNDAMASH